VHGRLQDGQALASGGCSDCDECLRQRPACTGARPTAASAWPSSSRPCTSGSWPGWSWRPTSSGRHERERKEMVLTISHHRAGDRTPGRGSRPLVRWRHPAGPAGSPSPARGRGDRPDRPLGWWVLEEALRQPALALRGAGHVVCVNLTVSQLNQPTWSAGWPGRSRPAAWPPAADLELTETMLMRDTEAVIAKLWACGSWASAGHRRLRDRLLLARLPAPLPDRRAQDRQALRRRGRHRSDDSSSRGPSSAWPPP